MSWSRSGWLLAAGLLAVTPSSTEAHHGLRMQSFALAAETPNRPPTRPWPAWDHHIRANIDEVRWTVPRDEPIKRLAKRWGMKTSLLRRFNPDLGRTVDQNDTLVVYRRPQSSRQYAHGIGTPNRGRMSYAVPFPEGPNWQLRTWRRRLYGTDTTVTTLMAVFDAFRTIYPETAPFVVGEISKRYGGRALPHASHQSGRDADIGYIVTRLKPRSARWIKPTKKTFDAEKNWILLRGLIATGTVESIFVDAKFQRLMLEHARNELPPNEVAAYFSVAAPTRKAATRAHIRHWKGHVDHMHVRFRCTKADVRCDGVGKKRRRFAFGNRKSTT